MSGTRMAPFAPRPAAAPDAPLSPGIAAHVAAFRRDGYAVVRGVFAPAEVDELKRAFDRERSVALKHPRNWRHGNLCYRVADDPNLGRIATMAQWPAYHDSVLAEFRADPRMRAILEPLIGRELKQIINQCHWKPPGAAVVDYAYHQDVRFRRPRAAFRNLETSYIQTAVAVDPHHRGNGGMRVMPGSHRLGEIAALAEGTVLGKARGEAKLVAVGLDPEKLVDLDLAPGDVGLWGPFLVHGSGANRGSDERRLYLNSYVRAADCDRGEWAFRDGRPVALGAPQLVHYEELYTRPEPHYLESAPPSD